MTVNLSVDAMGGDGAPEIIIQGLGIAAQRYPSVHFFVYGDKAVLEPLVASTKALHEKATVIHCDEVISPEMKPSAAVRNFPNSSMRRAIKSVVEGKAEGVVSAGNTGAYMALAKMLLKTMDGIDRPALASLAPTIRGESVILDLGANVECSAENLKQFAIMGEVFARYVLHLPHPTIGIVNVGSEEIKGSSIVKKAADLLRASSLKGNFYGYIEGNDIAKGTVDVVVMDGFTGNIVLKAAEGVMQLALEYFKASFRSSWLARLGYFFASPMLRKLAVRLDYRRYNGGIWLGLNGIAIKSHGGADAFGFAHAIDLAVDMVESKMNQHLLSEFNAESGSKKAMNS